MIKLCQSVMLGEATPVSPGRPRALALPFSLTKDTVQVSERNRADGSL